LTTAQRSYIQVLVTLCRSNDVPEMIGKNPFLVAGTTALPASEYAAKSVKELVACEEARDRNIKRMNDEEQTESSAFCLIVSLLLCFHT